MEPKLPIQIKGTVIYGNQIGRRIGFPTANIIPDLDLTDYPYGVYVSKVYVGDRVYKGISNLGVKPTVQDDPRPNVETHILGLDADLYGDIISVELIAFTRPERKFSSIEELKQQIAQDIEAAYSLDLQFTKRN